MYGNFVPSSATLCASLQWSNSLHIQLYSSSYTWLQVGMCLNTYTNLNLRNIHRYEVRKFRAIISNSMRQSAVVKQRGNRTERSFAVVAVEAFYGGQHKILRLKKFPFSANYRQLHHHPLLFFRQICSFDNCHKSAILGVVFWV